ncbi:MAG: hypothetical protein J6T10_30465 [Methanobrevibacter sp.]|nr:hypothetical protein [Methanobrevibacter sp.]
MAWAKTTIIGAIDYYEGKEEKLFDFLTLPEGIDKETVVDAIIYKASDFEMMHINPPFVRYAIGAWSNKWLPTWEKWYDVLNMEYNPIHNYDRTEEGYDKHTGTQGHSGSEHIITDNSGTQTIGNTGTQTNVTAHSGTVSNTGTQETTNTGTQNTAENSTSNALETPGKHVVTDHENITNGSQTTTNEVMAFNSSNWSGHDKSTVDNNVGHTRDSVVESGASNTAGSSQGNSLRTDDLNETRTDNLNELSTGLDNSTRTDNLSSTRTDALSETKNGQTTDTRLDDLRDDHYLRAYGNIGVTSTQQMIQQELDLRLFNMVEKISDMFIQEFCLMIY